MVGGEGMTHADRIALVNCLYAELPANDLAWYKDISCESSVSRGFLEPNGACSGDGSTSPLRQAGELDNILRGLLNGFSRNPTQI